MNKTKIEWCDCTWNPVTGCLHDCEYCYARKMANRFKCKEYSELNNVSDYLVLDEPVISKDKKEAFPMGFKPTFHKYRLDEPGKKTVSQNIFVCSMADLFGEWVPDTWIMEVFKACENAPQHRYLFLTKNPNRYIDLSKKGVLPEKENMWYGTSVVTPDKPFFYSDRHNTFVSIEPIQQSFGDDAAPFVNWVIVGAETGNRKEKVIPQKEWIEQIARVCYERDIPLLMKDSLIPIIGEENMRREFPW